MTFSQLLLRNLLYYRKMHIAVALGVGVGTAILAGALLVGSSVRASLRDLTLDRLGKIDHVLVGERYFRESIADSLTASGATAGGIVIRGSSENPLTGARASRIQIHGIDEAFWEFYGLDPPDIGTRDILLNRFLADELGIEPGQDILLRFQTDTLIPAESTMGRKYDNVHLVRLKVAEIIENKGPGRFGLSPHQQLPFNVFVSKSTLQRVLEQPARINALLVAGGTEDNLVKAWKDAFSLEDANLIVRPLEDSDVLLVETDRIVLEDAASEAIRTAARNSNMDSIEVLTYLANRIDIGNRTIPYSTVTAISEIPDSLRLANGRPVQELQSGQILLNQWAADDLRARTGQLVTVHYYTTSPGNRLETATHEFRLAGLVRMDGAAIDPDYAPVYKGMTDQTRIANWDPPFPIDLSLIRAQDEAYWDRYRAVPKAFVSFEDARNLWSSRFGQLTSFRIEPEAGLQIGAAADLFRQELKSQLHPEEFDLSFIPVKRLSLEASAGATDFSGLFLGFSLFLITSAAILVALLFRLGVEQRTHEIGILLATGHTPRLVRHLLLAEGGILAIAGCILGIPGAIAYAWVMIYGLSTWWSDAVGGSFLSLHVLPQDAVAGALGAGLLMMGSIWLSLRRLVKLPPKALLFGVHEQVLGRSTQERKARRLSYCAATAAVIAMASLALSMGSDSISRLGAFFGAGTLLLIASLVWFRALLLGPRRSAGIMFGISQLGIRNGARNPTRSVLSVALVACASFMIVTVSMNRQDVQSQEPDFLSGDGGFRVIADSDLPLFQDSLDSFVTEQASAMTIFPMRRQDGEDASCLNLYKPSSPSLTGLTDAFIDRGGFAFQSTLAELEAEKDNPWLLLRKDYGGAIPVFGDANSVMWILHLGLGQELTVTDDSGKTHRLLIAGLLSRSIFQSELLLSEQRFLELYPGHNGYQSLLAETNEKQDSILLETSFADQGLDATQTADRLASYLVVENTYLSTFMTLGGLGLLLGTLGLAIVIVRSILERRSELALLEALGLKSNSILQLILTENSFLLVFGVSVGTASALLAVTPHLMSGLADPPWFMLSLTLGVIVCTGLIAGAVAAVLALRTPLLASLRSE